jgi:chaperonin GroES
VAIELETTLKLEEIVTSKNVAAMLSPADRAAIGDWIFTNWQADEMSRSEWSERNADALKLAMQVREVKNFPWLDASNVKFPLVTIAALQYHAMAYPRLVPPTNIVGFQVFGPDPGGQKHTQGKKLADHMSWQLLEDSPDWESETDLALLTQPITGVFRKVFFDPLDQLNHSEWCSPADVTVPYFSRSFETAERITHSVERSRNYIVSRQRAGLYLEEGIELPLEPEMRPQTATEMARDDAQGVAPTGAMPGRPFMWREQRFWLDLDGDGYAEPYVGVVIDDGHQLLRIAPNFTTSSIERNPAGEVQRIVADPYFIKYPFIPSPDGGFYDLTFGSLLGPLNHSVDTIINQLIDAGTLSALGGGFFGRGIKMRGGQVRFAPGEWKPIDTIGDDIRKNIVPLPVPEPSPVLFQLLGLLIEYGQLIVGATETALGKLPGQNTPAEVFRRAESQGVKVFGAIFKRTWRALRQEFRLWADLNRTYLPIVKRSNPFGVTAADYSMDPTSIRPSADPAIVSDEQALQQAVAMAERAGQPGLGYDRYKVETNLLRALKVPQPEVFLPQPGTPGAPQPPPNPKLLEIQVKMQALQLKQQEFQFHMRERAAELLQDAQLTEAKIAELTAKAAMEAAKADTAAAGQAIEAINLSLALEKEKHAASMSALQTLTKLIETLHATSEPANAPAGGEPAGGS